MASCTEFSYRRLLEQIEELGEKNPSLKAVVDKSLDVLVSSLGLYSYRGLAYSFNGGKDSSVAFHLLQAAVARHCKEVVLKHAEAMQDEITEEHIGDDFEKICQEAFTQIRLIFFDSAEQFTEIRDFVDQTCRTYNVTIMKHYGGYKQGLVELLEDGTAAVMLGVRDGDPGSDELEFFTPSSPGWPHFMRICPILRWSYSQVWQFLRELELPYCGMYDQGYTSIGKIHNTTPNPALLVPDPSGNGSHYLPAYALTDGTLERCARSLQPTPRTSPGRRGSGRGAAAGTGQDGTAKSAPPPLLQFHPRLQFCPPPPPPPHPPRISPPRPRT